MKKILVIILFLVNIHGFSQENKCGRYGKKTVEERNNTFPFSNAKGVLLISYTNYEIGSELADTLTLDEAKAIDPHIIRKYEFNIESSSPGTIYFAIEEKELNSGWKNELSHILCNYIFVKGSGDVIYGQSMCYAPRNAILFLDENENVVCCYELCFQCGGSVLSPDPEGLNKYAYAEGCHARLDEIKYIFRKNGIEYGIKE